MLFFLVHSRSFCEIFKLRSLPHLWAITQSSWLLEICKNFPFLALNLNERKMFLQYTAAKFRLKLALNLLATEWLKALNHHLKLGFCFLGIEITVPSKGPLRSLSLSLSQIINHHFWCQFMMSNLIFAFNLDTSSIMSSNLNSLQVPLVNPHISSTFNFNFNSLKFPLLFYLFFKKWRKIM